ncbi:MAG: hypothetical protein O2890_02135 [Cyanobacteria bacterium]|nr:hypothetical protein [Cyanobacteriota bacterium]MDA0865216.1 hypothetical protein [Cyanobacteriota bacterium]
MTDAPSEFDLAVSAYRTNCDLLDMTFEQPSEEHSKQVSNVIYLRTSDVGYVARYNVKRRRILI